MQTHCKATTKSGAPCAAQPIRPSGYCWVHDPQCAEQQAAWRRKGGQSRSNRRRALAKLPDELMGLRDVQAMLCLTLRAVIAGRLEPGVGNAAASIARAIAALAQAGDIEERVAELERAAGLETKGRTA